MNEIRTYSVTLALHLLVFVRSESSSQILFQADDKQMQELNAEMLMRSPVGNKPSEDRLEKLLY